MEELQRGVSRVYIACSGTNTAAAPSESAADNQAPPTNLRLCFGPASMSAADASVNLEEERAPQGMKEAQDSAALVRSPAKPAPPVSKPVWQRLEPEFEPAPAPEFEFEPKLAPEPQLALGLRSSEYKPKKAASGLVLAMAAKARQSQGEAEPPSYGKPNPLITLTPRGLGALFSDRAKGGTGLEERLLTPQPTMPSVSSPPSPPSSNRASQPMAWQGASGSAAGDEQHLG